MIEAHYKNTQYSNTTFYTKTPKSLEYDVVAQVTSELKIADQDIQDFASKASALDKNTRMWAIIAASVADPRNAYPADLKASLFYLYEFTAIQTKKALANEVDIKVLIDINMSILKGLKGQNQ